MKKYEQIFEYKEVYTTVESLAMGSKKINKYAKDGWRLHTYAPIVGNDTHKAQSGVYIFERPISKET